MAHFSFGGNMKNNKNYILELILIFLKAPFLVDFPRPPNLAIFVAPTSPLANALHS